MTSKTKKASAQIKQWSNELGFQDCKITDTHLNEVSEDYLAWLDKHFQGSMSYMERNVDKRFEPSLLVANTIHIISVRLNYLPKEDSNPIKLLAQNDKAYISRYALGRDYHKIIRKRLQKLVDKIQNTLGGEHYRVFTDSAPILEKPIAKKAGIGWVGKHSNILNKDDGSWFFLGEIFTDLKLQNDPEIESHCGTCTECMKACPTQAIIKPYVVDARKCISYLTIENKGPIPLIYRKAIGNRIYGCDDCQLFCPWNKFAKISTEDDFSIRHHLNNISILDCFNWSEEEFLKKMEGSAIRRIGYIAWIRNCTIALGNGCYSDEVYNALSAKLESAEGYLKEHIEWAITQINS